MHSHPVCEFLDDSVVVSEHLFLSFLLPILGSFELCHARMLLILGADVQSLEHCDVSQ